VKFVDEAIIHVIAGKGGDGCLSFLREKCRPKGGPDGGDGGDGGSIYLKGNRNLDTLADFRYSKFYRAQSGENGAGKNRLGKQGKDFIIEVPLGTIVSDHNTKEFIGDIICEKTPLLMARGGKHGLGNSRFKSSINRTPRRITPGQPGDERMVKLELKLLADVGLLGLPNAGKSTFLSTVSNAKPKIANYPFTTLYPQLGVVEVKLGVSFVIADIPGLIPGASGGLGLGIRFLKHLKRTRILLHLVDISPFDERGRVDQSVKEIEAELYQFDDSLYRIERWLVLTKIELLSEEKLVKIQHNLINKLKWRFPIYRVSAITGQGIDSLIQDLFARLKQIKMNLSERCFDGE